MERSFMSFKDFCDKFNKKYPQTKLTKRLNIIEGQLKGIRQMLEDDRYCQDIVIQISAVDKSLKTFSYSFILLPVHTQHQTNR